MHRNDLKSLGMSEGLIDLYIKNKSIIWDNGSLKISNDLVIRLFLSDLKKGQLNSELLQSFTDDEFTKMYMQLLNNLYLGNKEMAKIYLCVINNKYSDNEYKEIIALYNYLLNDIDVDNLRITYDDNQYIGFKVNLVKKYIKLHQYAIASDLLEDILKIEDNVYLQILKRVCSVLPSKTLYIVGEGKIKDEATRMGIARMERRMLVDLEQGEPLLVSKNFNNLVSFDIGGNVYQTIISLIKWIDIFKTNYRKISNRDLRAIYGDFDSVITNLLASQDFYRLKTVVDDAYNNDEIFSIKVQMYKILIDVLMKYNKRNKDFIDQERKSSLTKSNEQVLIEKYPVSSIHINTIDDEVFNTQVDLSKDYYQVYEHYYKMKKYKDAKRALLQFFINMASINVTVNFDYLIKELDILIANESDQKENKDKVEELEALAKELEEKDIDKAIIYYLEILKYQSHKNPRILSRIAHLYNKKKDYEQALTYFLEADEVFVYPDDYVVIMEILIKTKNYQSVSRFVRKYDAYCPQENAYLYYLLSVAYANQQLYDLAEDALNTAAAINMVYYNVEDSYNEELEILNKLRNGKNVSLYTPRDFVNYDLNHEEKELLGYVDELKQQDEKSYLNHLQKDALNKPTIEDKIAYLLMLIKIFNYKEDEQSVLEFVSLVEALLNSDDISSNRKEEITKKLRIYKIY